MGVIFTPPPPVSLEGLSKAYLYQNTNTKRKHFKALILEAYRNVVEKVEWRRRTSITVTYRIIIWLLFLY